MPTVIHTIPRIYKLYGRQNTQTNGLKNKYYSLEGMAKYLFLNY